MQERMNRRDFWTPGDWFLAESAHLGWGSFASFVALHYTLPWWVYAILIGVALIKEAIVDPILEGDLFWTDGMVDFAFYVAGLPVAMFTWWIGS